MTANEPETTPVAQHPGSPNAWVLLIGLFVAMIALQLFGKPPARRSGVDTMELASRFKMAVLANEFTDTAKKTPSEKQKSELQGDLQAVYREALEGVRTNTAAAAIALAAGKELNLPAAPEALDTLKKSTSRMDQRIAAIYGTPPPTPVWVSQNKGRLPQNFLGKVIRKHALAVSGQPSQVTGFKSDALILGLVFIGGLLVVAIGIVALLSLVIAHFSGGVKAVGHPFQGLSKAESDRLALRVCGFFVLMMGLPLPLSLLLSGLPWTWRTVLFEGLLLAAFLAFLKMPVLGVRDPVQRLIGQTKSWPKLTVIGFLAFAANLPIVMVLAVVVNRLFPGLPDATHPLAERMTTGADTATLLTMLFTASVMAPILEELSFRGLLFPALTAFMKPVPAMLVTGFAFASIHPQGPALWAALGMVGAVASGLTYYTGSLIPAMVMHCCHNTAILALGWVMQY